MSALGHGPIGGRSLGSVDANDLQGAARPYEAELVAANRELFLAVDLETYDENDGGLDISRLATSEFVTEPDDEPANTIYEGRLGRSFNVQRRIPLAEGFYGGVIRPSFSEIEIDNADGGFDTLLGRAIDGRVVTVRAGKSVRIASNAWQRRIDQSGIILKARASQWTGSAEKIRIPLRDITEQLNRPAAIETYAGTGQGEGPEALADKSKPIALGRCFNVQPTLIDQGRNIYQISTGPIQSVDAVRDSGLVLDGQVFFVDGGYDDLDSIIPPAGSYAVSLQSGMIRLGSPPAGVVTVDCKGVKLDTVIVTSLLWDGSVYWSNGIPWLTTTQGPGYVETAAGLIRWLLVKGLNWGRNVIDQGAFDLLDRSQPAPCGLYIPAGSSMTVGQAVEAIAAPLGIYLAPGRVGTVQLGRLEAPTAIAPLALTEIEIIRIERLPLPYTVPPYRWEIGYRTNNRVMSDSEFVAAVTLEDRQIFGLESQTSAVESVSVRNRHLTSTVQRIETPLALAADAATEAARLRDLYTSDRILIRCEVPIIGQYNTVGREVTVTHRSFGLGGGRNMRIVAVDEDAGRNRCTVTLFG